ncbi:MAG: hypothetical protein HY928_09745 [Elusimicrobia bacterium]|nr:hypothetical protein [Elusimicrobiota bacterium]
MALHLRALIAQRPVLEAAARGLKGARLSALTDELSMFALTGPVEDQFSHEGPLPFDGLKAPPGLAEAANKASMLGPVAYIEADYKKGLDFQAAAVWSGGAVVGGPWVDGTAWDPREPGTSERPVNSALRLLGVGAGEYADEWDAVALARHLTTEDWAAQGEPF